MRFPQIAGNDQALAVAAKGELDWFGSFLPDIEKTYVGIDPEHHGYWFPGGSMVAFTLNFETKNEGNKEAFNDLNFRHAFSMAMDRQAMVDIAGYGYPTLNEYPSGLGRAFHSWNNAEVDAKYGAVLELQYRGGQGSCSPRPATRTPTATASSRRPTASQISFDIIVPNGWTDWVNTVQLAVEGLTADRHQRHGRDAGSAGLDRRADRPATSMSAINSVPRRRRPRTFMFDLASAHAATRARPASPRRTTRNPELDKLLDDFYETADKAEQTEIMNEIQTMIGADMPYVAGVQQPALVRVQHQALHRLVQRRQSGRPARWSMAACPSACCTCWP